MNYQMKSNLVVAANVWIDAENPDGTTAWQAAAQIPGDLMIEFIAKESPHLNPRDKQILAGKMTPAQIREYLDRRFFLNHGEHGPAFEVS
jgi:hypothetical protein